MIVNRDISGELKNLMNSYPVVTITGPRQSGKTTLSKITYPEYNYCNLENPEIRSLALNDPNAFFEMFPYPLIIDEIQRVPQLLSYIQTIVDEQRENGMFLLTGSQQLLMGESVTQSLAGRTALLQLLPFSIKEISALKIPLKRDELIYKGFLPRIYDQNQDPTRAYRNYFQTYVERDLRQLMNIQNLALFENFVKILAGRVGQVVNLHSISSDLGVSSPVLKRWLSVLEASFIIFLLYPYYENFGKRLIKSPKIYFSDVGLASYLLGIENRNQVSRDPLLGGLFENMIVLEAVKARLNKGLDPGLYFFRDNNGNEVDIVYKKHNDLIPVEIKAAMTYNDTLTKGVKYFKKTVGKAKKGYLIYCGDMTFKSEDFEVINFVDTYKIFQ